MATQNNSIRQKATPEKPIIVDDLVISRLKEYDDYAWHKLMYVSLMTGVDDLVNRINELEKIIEEQNNAKTKNSRK